MLSFRRSPSQSEIEQTSISSKEFCTGALAQTLQPKVYLAGQGPGAGGQAAPWMFAAEAPGGGHLLSTQMSGQEGDGVNSLPR